MRNFISPGPVQVAQMVDPGWLDGWSGGFALSLDFFLQIIRSMNFTTIFQRAIRLPAGLLEFRPNKETRMSRGVQNILEFDFVEVQNRVHSVPF
jgi:hypothetical protein